MELYGLPQDYNIMNQKLAILSIYEVFRVLQPLIDSPELTGIHHVLTKFLDILVQKINKSGAQKILRGDIKK